MNRVGIGIGMVVVAGIVLFLVFRGSWPGREALPVGTDEPQAAQPEVAPPSGTAADARVDALPLPPPPPGLRVLVQDRERRPVAGATIDVRGEDRDLAFPPTGADGWTQAARMPHGDVYLTARAAGASGSSDWRWTATMATEVTIWLARDRDVEVTVTDRTGAPYVGATVGLFGGKEADFRTTSVKAETGDDGIARFHLEGRTWLALHATMRAVAMMGSARYPVEPVAWDEIGPTRVAIVLDMTVPPPGPALRVRFVDKDGAPVAAKGELGWSRIVPAGVGTWEAPAGAVQVDGIDAVVSRLLDGDHIRLRLRETGRLESELELTLPVGAREQEVSLPRGPVAPRLEIPVVDGTGKPVTTGSFVVTVLLTNGGYEHESTVQPDAEGMLVVSLDDRRAGKVEIAEPRDPSRLYWPEPPRLKRPYRTSIGGEPPPNPPLAVMEFAAPDVAEVIRLASVTLPDVAPRIHGVVLDVTGKPAAGVRVWLTTVSQPEPKPFADFEAKTDAEGRFAIRATELPEEVFVGARRPLGFCTPLRVRPSPEPITLRLQPTGAIAMDLRTPERPVMPEEIARQLRARIDLRTDEDALADGTWMFFRQRSPVFEKGYRDRWGAYSWPPEQGECVLRDLVPGEYHLLGSIGANGVLDVPGVRVLAGETVRPAGTQGVTIGAGIEAAVVRVRSADGRPLAKVRVRLMLPEWEPKMAQPAWKDTDAGGEAWFIVPRGALADVEFAAQEMAPMMRKGTPFPIEVTMGAGTSLDFVISGIREVAADSRAVLIGCMSIDGTPPESPVHDVAKMRSFRHPNARLDDGGRATIPNLPPGRYRLWLGSMPPVRSAREYTFVLLGDREITVQDPAHVIVEHAVTAAETATLLGR